MSKGSNPIIDLIRLLLLVILLPLILLLIGPLLVIAAMRGSITLGSFQLRPNKYYYWGRIWAFGLGIVVWVFIWGSVAQFWLPNFSMPTRWLSSFERLEKSETPGQPNGEPIGTRTIRPLANASALTATVAWATATYTAQPLLTETTRPSPTPIVTTTLFSTFLSTSSITTTITSSQTALSPPLFPVQQNELIQALNTANDVLIHYLQAPIPAQEVVLKTIWVGDALQEVQQFAQKISTKYQAPLTITYRIIDKPVITAVDASSITIQTKEFWTFEDSAGQQESLSNYVYTLQGRDGNWRIIAYRFDILPLPDTPSPITNTTIITSEQ